LTIAWAPAALAQEAVGEWIWSVSTDDGDAVVEPGETATILLALDFEPSVGEIGLTGEVVTGLAKATFDTLGGANADRGMIVDWFVWNNLADFTGDLTTTDGVSLFGTNAQQGLADFVVPDDPIDVISINWATADFSGYEVHYATSMLEPLLVWEGGWDPDGEQVEWSTIEADVSFQVVPAPEGAVIVCALFASAARRRRGGSFTARDTSVG
jgi:hypothetical protein